MDLMEKLDKREIREFFSKNWMTHDAMWFGSVMQELGAEKANEINKGAVKAMSGVEIKRILKLMGKPKNAVITTFEELKEIIDTTYKLIQPEFMKLYYGFPDKNVFRGGFHECFAHDGGLGVKYDMIPEFNGCLMHQNGKCEIEFRFYLD